MNTIFMRMRERDYNPSIQDRAATKLAVSHRTSNTMSKESSVSTIRTEKEKLILPKDPIIPYIRGDGIGIDITPVMIDVIDNAVEKSYSGKRKINWLRVFAGEDALQQRGINIGEALKLPDEQRQNIYLPPETLDALKKYRVSIKGPLTTPIGGGFRSLNVSLRQILDLYACVRPIRWYPGVPAPLKEPGKLNVVVFRENTEDVYAGIEWAQGTPAVEKVIAFLKEMGETVPADSAIGIKLMSVTASKRLVRAALHYAVKHKCRNVTMVHKGNIMKYTEGGFMNWGYEVARDEFREVVLSENEFKSLSLRRRNPKLTVKELSEKLHDEGVDYTEEALGKLISQLETNHGGDKLDRMIVVKDRIADQMFQQLLLRPDEYDIIATPNLNGDYISDACAAEVGGLGIAPGANINYESGVAVFEATHGTAPKYAGLNKANPSSMILSAVMMLQYMGWDEAADLVEKNLAETIQAGTVTYDLHRQMQGAKLVSCSGFGSEIVHRIRG